MVFQSVPPDSESESIVAMTSSLGLWSLKLSASDLVQEIPMEDIDDWFKVSISNPVGKGDPCPICKGPTVAYRHWDECDPCGKCFVKFRYMKI